MFICVAHALLAVYYLFGVFLSHLDAKTALIVMQPGFEEIQAVTTMDVLRRAGMDVTLARLPDTDPSVIGAHGLPVEVPQILPSENETLNDVIVLTANEHTYAMLAGAPSLVALLHRYEESNRTVAAIDCAQAVLAFHSIYLGKNITVSPTIEPQMKGKYAMLENMAVVTDMPLITAQGTLDSLNFSTAIVSELVSKELTDRLFHKPSHFASASISVAATAWFNLACFVVLLR